MSGTPSLLPKASFARTVLAELRAARQSVGNAWIDHTFLDYVVASALCLAQALGLFSWFSLAPGDRSVYLQTLAGAIAAVLGVGTVAVTLIHTNGFGSGRRGGAAIEVSLRRQYTGCVRALLVALGAVCLLFAVDRSRHAGVHDVALVGAMAVAALRTARLFWLLRRMVETDSGVG